MARSLAPSRPVPRAVRSQPIYAIPALPNIGIQFAVRLFGTLSRGLPLWMIACAFLGALSCPSAATDRTDTELQCLALTIYHESRGEPDAGKLAVAHVVMNRAKSQRFPRTICEVVYQSATADHRGCEFTWTCDAVSDQPADLASWLDSVRIARSVYWGYARDPTDGAMWYHADYVEPDWAATLSAPQRLGRHLFYRTHDSLNAAPALARPPARQAIVTGVMPESSVPSLPETTRSFLAELRITMLLWATDVSDRAVRINDAMYHEGDELAPGLILASIASGAIVVRYQDRLFRFML